MCEVKPEFSGQKCHRMQVSLEGWSKEGIYGDEPGIEDGNRSK